MVLAAGVGALLALVAVIAACTARTTARRWIAAGVAVVFLLATAGVFVAAVDPAVFDGRFRTYRAFYEDVREGMTREEIFTLVDRHYPEFGPRQRPIVVKDAPRELGFFMNPEGSRQPNCEAILLALDESGRVKEKAYIPD